MTFEQYMQDWTTPEGALRSGVDIQRIIDLLVLDELPGERDSALDFYVTPDVKFIIIDEMLDQGAIREDEAIYSQDEQEARREGYDEYRYEMFR